VVDGDTLVHTDVTPFNFLIHQDGVTVVDWSMPCRGASWIDTALMTIRLIRAGHRPEQAEAWAEQTMAWSGANPESVDAFAAGIAMLTRERHSQRPSSSHLGPLADAAESWARYRIGAKSGARM
jgi:aminoglycoside phosphotransferase (APT) family kinase protein